MAGIGLRSVWPRPGRSGKRIELATIVVEGLIGVALLAFVAYVYFLVVAVAAGTG